MNSHGHSFILRQCEEHGVEGKRLHLKVTEDFGFHTLPHGRTLFVTDLGAHFRSSSLKSG
jgi:hypothetical protein